MNLLLRYAAFVALSIIGSLFAAAGEARAEQCVSNKGGFAIKVYWFKVGSIARGLGTSNQLVAVGAPVGTHTLALGMSTCNKSTEVMIVAVSVAGCTNLKMYGRDANCAQFTFAESDLPVSLAGIRVGNPNYDFYDPSNNQPVSSPVVSPLNCDHRAAYDLNQRVCSVDTHSFPPPEAPRFAWIGRPSTTQHLNFWGTVFDVQWGPGGPN